RRTPSSCSSTTSSGRCRSTGKCCSCTRIRKVENPLGRPAEGFFFFKENKEARIHRMKRVLPILMLLGCGTRPPVETDDRTGPKPVMRAWRGSTPGVDGQISPGEWDDATTFIGCRGWIHTFSPTTDDRDLSLQGWVKHDGENLYFAFRVEDDVL